MQSFIKALTIAFGTTLAGAVLALAGCGGGGQITNLATLSGQPEARPVSNFSVRQLDPGATGGYNVESSVTNGQTLVQIRSTGDSLATGVYLELAYDASRYNPLVAQVTDALAPRADSLVVEKLDQPGRVVIGQAPAGVSANSLAAGDLVAEVLFDAAPFSGTRAARSASMVPVDAKALSPMVWDAVGVQLQWYFTQPGDYDQNGVVGVTDLAPLGKHFGEAGPFPYESALSVIDGNRDGVINVQDLTLIGQRYGSSIEGYNLYASDDINDVPATYDAVSTIPPIASFMLDEADDTGPDTRLRFSYPPDPGDYGKMFWARPFVNVDGTLMEGTRSNLNGPNIDAPPPPGGPGDLPDPDYNLAPVAALTLILHGENLPLPVTLDGSASNDPDGQIAFFEWDFEGDGLFDAFGQEPTVEHTYLAAGSYAPVVRVTDNNGATDTFMSPPFEVTAQEVSNIDPFADLFATTMSGYAPLTVGFLASGSYDVDGQISHYMWDFDGDGQSDLDSGTDPSVLHTYDTPGEFEAKVTVIDNRGGMADATETISVVPQPVNQAPVAALTLNPAMGVTPLEVELDGSGSADPDGEIVEYAWDVNGDGAFENFTENPMFSYTYTMPGSFDVGLRVKDNLGLTSFTQKTLSVNVPGNELPVADLQATPLSGDAPLQVAFDASASSDPDGSIVRYDFDFNDDGAWDAYDAPATINWTYDDPGSFVARLRVTDNKGAQDTAQLTIDVNVVGNDPPTASLSASPSSGDAPLSVTFDATGSSDSDGSIVKFEWDFDGDGVYDGYGQEQQPVHVYPTPGSFVARCRVTDDDGSQDTAQQTIDVSAPGNESPTASLTADSTSGNAPLQVELDASGSSDTDGTIELYEWDFDGDGLFDGYGDQDTVNHTYNAAGTYMALVRVTDDGGSQDTAEQEINVSGGSTGSNQPPTASFTADPPGGNSLPLEVDFDPSNSSDPDGSIVKYEWDFDGNGVWDAYTYSPIVVQHTYTVGDTYQPVLRVTDDGGLFDEATISLDVSGLPTAVLEADQTSAPVGTEIHFDGSNSSDPGGSIVLYEWDLDGNGSFETNTGTTPTTSHTYNSEDDYNVQLRVTDNDGATDTDTLVIQIAFAEVTVVDSLNTPGQSYLSAAIINGNPAIAYKENTLDDLWYCRASNDSGSAWGTPVQILSTGNVGDDVFLAEVNSRPALVYIGSDDTLRWMRANDANGTSWPSSAVNLYSGTNPGEPAIAILDGVPAIGFKDNSTHIYFKKADNADGSAWTGSWNTAVNVTNVGDIKMAVVNGKPAFAFRHYRLSQGDAYFKYVIATNSSGTAWASPVTIKYYADSINLALNFDLAVLGTGAAARPAVIFDVNWTTVAMYFCVASDIDGSAWPAPTTYGSQILYDPELIFINGYPNFLYYDNPSNQLKLRVGTDTYATGWGAIQTIDPSGDAGDPHDPIDLNNKLGVAYYEANLNDLKFARVF